MSKKSFYDFDNDKDIFSNSNKQSNRNVSRRDIDKKRPKQNVLSNNRNFPSSNPNREDGSKTNSKRIANIPIDKRKQVNKIKKKKKYSPIATFSKVFFSIILVCILILGCVYAYISNIFDGVNIKENNIKPNKYIDESKLMGKDGVKNILLIGGDDPQGGKSFRSDTMMLMTIDTNHKKIKLSSFLRDSYVKIPGRTKAKLNASCAYGGLQLVKDTIEYNFHIKIDNYVLVDFNAFEKIIDVLDGVNVPVTAKEASYMNRNYSTFVSGVKSFHVKSGKNVHLNGKEALLFSRIRKLDSDFMRTKRQRMVMSNIKSKMSTVSKTKILSLMKEIAPYIETDISKNQLTMLSVTAATTYLKYEIVQRGVPETDEWYSQRIKGQDMVMFKDLDKTREDLKKFLYDE